MHVPWEIVVFCNSPLFIRCSFLEFLLLRSWFVLHFSFVRPLFVCEFLGVRSAFDCKSLDRKDFTELELSKNMTALVKAVGERLRNTFSAMPAEKADSTGGRPKGSVKADSQEAIAKEIGIPQRTISDAIAHTKAVEQYPALEPLPKTTAISITREAKKQPIAKFSFARFRKSPLHILCTFANSSAFNAESPSFDGENAPFQLYHLQSQNAPFQ